MSTRDAPVCTFPEIWKAFVRESVGASKCIFHCLAGNISTGL